MKHIKFRIKYCLENNIESISIYEIINENKIVRIKERIVQTFNNDGWLLTTTKSYIYLTDNEFNQCMSEEPEPESIRFIDEYKTNELLPFICINGKIYRLSADAYVRI
jgi:hypothetical protein